ncbi:hypothetical protein [Namhaeicola litoreus]|uniref:Sigma-70 family RNA polymerase sigma factor n=1 Tax=Namhaeicola litoreus TaxID=1052145 RepID=A0ABW3Y017_9FLAO
MKNEHDNNSEKREKSLEKKTLAISHKLYPYVKNRLRVLEHHGVLPKNMYRPSEIIDEVILEVYENKVGEDIDQHALQMFMFAKAHYKIIALADEEKWHKQNVSIKLILEEELKQMEENFTVDGDFDLIMNEELDDISYHQNDEGSSVLESEEVQQNLMSLFELKEHNKMKEQGFKQSFQTLYKLLPVQTSNVVDLYILGKLNLKDIGTILETDIVEVKRIVQFVKENFKKQIE